jgi:hypothetical protein
MAQAAGTIRALEAERAETGSVPWYVWSFVAATSSAVVGAVWDISWHKSIGRDSFWTPAHLLIYLCGILAGLTSAWLVWRATLGEDREARAASIGVWGFRGPLGAFLGAWGGVAMLASAPFDDWWHNAYGLDVKILSPPHMVLILGTLTIRFATLLLVLGEMNRAAEAGREALRRKLDWLLLFTGTLLMGGAFGAFLELTTRNYMHSARFYLIAAAAVPWILAGVSKASRHKWAMTIMGCIFTVLSLAFLWILPLFPAEPKLGPVYQEVTHFIPNDFPVLLLFPAVALDLVRQRAAGWSRWRLAIVSGPVFLVVLLAVQWPFAEFLNSPASRNWVFGTHYIPYFVPAESDYARGAFTIVEAGAGEFLGKILLALAAATVSMRMGLQWGGWMRRLRR